jgi:3-deoxy-manno-octulosonate cytidylyltransferase (CMP-KDO synthetase)
MSEVYVIIPARYASTRFPGKPVVPIGGMSMVERVYRQAVHAVGEGKVWVATDDVRIAEHVQTFGAVCMTGECASGTDRCAEAARRLNLNTGVIVNVQGDEPFIRPEQISSLADLFSDPEVQIASLRKPIDDQDLVVSVNTVKVVCDRMNNALYFSRWPIPYRRENNRTALPDYRHLGVYAFRAQVLQEVAALEPGLLETAESLEQLRWLENGYRIRMAETHFQSPAVDVPEDLAHVENYLKSHPDYLR